ncbi:MAG: hypothetical protein QXS68_06510 [Candidatus Methanomethylicaceae archaeon]
MRQVEQHWSDLSAPGGSRTVWELAPFPEEALLRKLVIRQTSGTPVSFTVRLYNHESTITTTGLSEYQVTDLLNSTSPGELIHFFGAAAPSFNNMDGSGPSTRKQAIYLEIQPSGSGAKQWKVALAGTVRA